MQDNNKRVAVFIIILIVLLSQIYEFYISRRYLESHCQYGFLEKEEEKQNMTQIECIACYNFEQGSVENGHVKITHNVSN